MFIVLVYLLLVLNMYLLAAKLLASNFETKG